MEPENAKKEKKNKKPLNQTFIFLKNFGFVFFYTFQGFFLSKSPEIPLFW